MEYKEKGIYTPITEAAKRPSLIPKGFTSPEAVVEIAYEKYVMYSPLYRQEQEWNRQGLKLDRQVMCNWLLACSGRYLRPVYEELRRRLLASEILHADETPVRVMHEEGRKPKTKSYMWLFMTGAHEERQIVLYRYDETRSSAVGVCAKSFSFAPFLGAESAGSALLNEDAPFLKIAVRVVQL